MYLYTSHANMIDIIHVSIQGIDIIHVYTQVISIINVSIQVIGKIHFLFGIIPFQRCMFFNIYLITSRIYDYKLLHLFALERLDILTNST